MDQPELSSGPLKPGAQLGPYTVIELIGAGGMGRVEGRGHAPDGGNWPLWRRQNEIILDTTPSGATIFAAPVETTATAFESGAQERLFVMPNSGADDSRDGQRVLVAAPTAQSAAPGRIVMILNCRR